MGDTCVPSLIVIGTAINQLETKVSPIKSRAPTAYTHSTHMYHSVLYYYSFTITFVLQLSGLL